MNQRWCRIVGTAAGLMSRQKTTDSIDCMSERAWVGSMDWILVGTSESRAELGWDGMGLWDGWREGGYSPYLRPTTTGIRTAILPAREPSL